MAQLQSLSIRGQSVVDFIVEQGTDGIWTYIKYNSGRYEAWYSTDSLSASKYSASGNIYVSDIQYEFAFPTFSTAINYYNGTASSQHTWSWGIIWIGVGVILLKVGAVAASDSSQGRCNLHIIGRWK